MPKYLVEFRRVEEGVVDEIEADSPAEAEALVLDMDSTVLNLFIIGESVIAEAVEEEVD